MTSKDHRDHNEEYVSDEQPEEDIVIEEEGSEGGDNALKKLRERLKECTEEKQEYLAGWQRAKADLINARKEFNDSRERLTAYANEELITDLLATLDSFEMAFSNKESWNKVDSTWRTGVEYIHSQLKKALQEHGLEVINTQAGDAFDPEIHTSMGSNVVADPAEDSTIAKVLQAGYRLNGKVIRPTRVVVNHLQE